MTKIIYEKGKPMREEGFIPSAKENIKNAIHSILSFPGKVMDGIEGRHKKTEDYKRSQNKKMIEENWGNEQNYKETMTPKEKQKEAINKTYKQIPKITPPPIKDIKRVVPTKHKVKLAK